MNPQPLIPSCSPTEQNQAMEGMTWRSIPSARGWAYLLRIIIRFAWLVTELARAALDYATDIVARGDFARSTRAAWLQKACRRALRVFNITVKTSGPIPSTGLLVSNHLSYLDVLVLGALAPATFIAKREVRGWPVFGWFAALAGTVFVNRHKRTDVARSNAGIQAALDGNSLVALFPEGTSSGGDAILPFKSALLEPAVQNRHPLTVCALHFRLEDGRVSDEVCYWRDMTFLPHLLNLLGKRGVAATVSFASIRERAGNRKELARQLHSETSRLLDESRNMHHEDPHHLRPQPRTHRRSAAHDQHVHRQAWRNAGELPDGGRP